MSLPQNYEKPAKAKSYFKPQDGESRVRIMTDIVPGYQDWKDQKPLNTKERNPSIDASKPAKHFRAVIIWNYAVKQFQCRQFTQSSIIDAIDNLEKDADWGDSKGYDLKINREGKDLLTKYTVTPGKQVAVTTEIQDAFDKLDYNLENLFLGEEVISSNPKESDDLPF